MASFLNAPESEDEEGIRENAARWVVRQDRRLSAEERAQFEAWLAADPRHAAAFERSQASWQMYREVGAAVRHSPAADAEARRGWNWTLLGGLAAAAAIALMFFPDWRAGPEPGPQNSAVRPAPPLVATRRLEDGSVARLRGGAEIAPVFSATERRVKLVRGTAFFTVTKDPARPFYVEAGTVTVRAVGTAFSVNFESRAVDVWVTEGTVQVTPPPAEKPAEAPMVKAGHRAVVARVAEASAPAVVVTAVSAEEIARTLAWNEPMLELGGSTLGELVTAFAERSGRRFEIEDPALAAVRIGGRFPKEDVDGFIRALEEIYEVKSERRADGVIVLSKPKTADVP